MPRSQNDFEKFLDHLIQSFPNNLHLQKSLGLDVTVPYEALGDIPWAGANDVRLDLAVNDYLLQISDERTIEVARKSDLLSRIRVHTNRMMVMNLIREAETDRLKCEGMTSLRDKTNELYPKYEEGLNALQSELLQVLCQIEDEKNTPTQEVFAMKNPTGNEVEFACYHLGCEGASFRGKLGKEITSELHPAFTGLGRVGRLKWDPDQPMRCFYLFDHCTCPKCRAYFTKVIVAFLPTGEEIRIGYESEPC